MVVQDSTIHDFRQSHPSSGGENLHRPRFWAVGVGMEALQPARTGR
jgi:hypothetical protein